MLAQGHPLLAGCAERLDTISSTAVTNSKKERDSAVNTVSTEEATTSEPEVLVEQRDRILIITINRPKAKNAVNAAVSRGLADAVDRLDGDQGLSVGILTGAGGSFCAGMDLKAFARGEVPIVEGRGMGFTERPPVKPLIAAVEGFALAGGTELALATDLIVASKDAAFGIPEVKRGLVAGGGGLLRLPERIPPAIAMELALTGENFTAERAHALGMVNVLAEPGGALEAAIALAERITVNGPLAVAATKRIIVESRGWSPDTRFAEQNTILMPVFSSNDAKEGAIAFAEKRPAHWTGT
jgi:enoyl-CoA hydratase/carnithine racemase